MRWRGAEAKRRRIPAFRVMTNAALQGIAAARPRDERELLDVKGIGPALAAKYGAALLELVRLAAARSGRPRDAGARGSSAAPGSARTSDGRRRLVRVRRDRVDELAGRAARGMSCPMPGISSSSEPGIAAAVSLPPSTGTSGSSVPWMTSVGARTPASSGARLPCATIAASWRAWPVGVVRAVVELRAARADQRLVERKAGAADPPPRLDRGVDVRLRARPAAGPASSARISGRAGGSAGFPVVDMIETRLRTRAGCRIATVCTIMPPIDAPTKCASSRPSASQRPTASSAMSSSV